MDKALKIIAVDDEETMLTILRRSLTPEGYELELFNSAPAALQRLQQGEPADIIITDLNMPEIDGLRLIKAAQALDPDLVIIVITAYASVASAVTAIKAGAYDFIPKPFDPEQLQIIVARAAETRKLKLENRGLRRQLAGGSQAPEIIGVSPAMRRILSLVAKIRESDGTVLLIGESGVGKELIAKDIHYRSRRAAQPFIAINCGALPDELLESELFGHEKGAFTGAVARKIGLCEAAGGGTLLLDEVSSISPAMQVKLLRFLQERNFRRLGGKETISVEVRVIAAANEDLKEATERGAFRKDLYYRLNVIPLEIPPLRERRDDIPLLARYFIGKFAAKTGKTIRGISREADDLLLRAAWEGNVRELGNVLERAITLTDGETIIADDLPAEVKTPAARRLETPSPYPVALTLAELEKTHIENVLQTVEGNKSRAARLLDIDYSTLRRKLSRWGMLVE